MSIYGWFIYNMMKWNSSDKVKDQREQWIWDVIPKRLGLFSKFGVCKHKACIFFAPKEISRRKVEEVQDKKFKPYNYSHEN